MRLYLLRHAEAESIAESDDVRALTELGWEQADAAADWLCQQVSGTVRLAASSLLRAQQTASVVQQALALARIETLESLQPEGDILRAEQDISLIARDDVDSLIVVSHMPLIASLASWLEDGILTTGGAFSLAEIRVLDAEVLAPGTGVCVDAFVPEDHGSAMSELRALLARF